MTATMPGTTLNPSKTASQKHLTMAPLASDPQLASMVFRECGIPLAVIERGRIVSANQAFAALFAYGDSQQMLGLPLAELLPAEHPCTIARWNESQRKEVGAQSGPGTRCGETHCVFNARRRDGSFARMESSCSALCCNGRDLLIISARDISLSERRSVQREPEKRFRAIFDWAAIGIAQVDLDGKIMECNRAFETMLGYERAELRGMLITGITHPGDVTAGSELYEELIAGKREHFQLEKRYARKDGKTIWARVTVSLVCGAAGQPEFAIGMVEDITQRKNAERELQESQKMEAVGRLVGGVAHDFNNLLTAVTLYSDLLLASVDKETSQHRHGQEIRMAADRGAALIKQLLLFVRPQTPQPEVLAIENVVAQMKDMLARLIGEHVELVTRVEAPLWPVKMDATELQQVILNLALNARDAMPERGTVTLCLRNVRNGPEDQDDIAPGSYVELAVTDNGCGMDQETRSHLFEPFFTTKPRGKGNGLGLVTVRRIVLQNRGAIRVDSEAGQGTTVKVLLPAEITAGTEELPSLTAAGAALGHETVLLVEDEAAVRESIRTVLAKAGYTVLEARNGTEALNVGRNYEGPVDLLVTDLVLPGIDGREVARSLLHSRPQISVLYISGYSHEPRAQTGEGEKILHKPFTGETLARKVREALKRSAP